jgi:hypothetical protein
MTALLYRPDIDAVRRRLTTWWHGGDLGRPVLLLTAPRAEPLEKIPALPEPPGWVTGYSTSNFAYRVNLAARNCVNCEYLGENVPQVAPDLAPNCLALYLGCTGVETPGTVWCEPCMTGPDDARFAYDRENFYWDFTLRLTREMLRLGRGKFLLQFPDLIEGLDTLAAMRGTQEMLCDLIERPEWVHASLRRITDLYFRYYDVLYDLMRDEIGGSHYWMWAPGRMAKFQCDCSAMISPNMFGEFMAPILREMCERVSYSMYHWDGPDAIPHHDHLLAIPALKMIQWTAGAGAEPAQDKRWWPLYHKTFDAGKKIYIYLETDDPVGTVRTLKREFRQNLKQFSLPIGCASRAQAEEVLKMAEV